ncbi:MAG: class I SAM-dependent methyltransferase [Candidatus Eisenbacteria bacterium]|nr:class I SAM-dependent methyltransferase [Candidatus Eisenbacteria bacterium]
MDPSLYHRFFEVEDQHWWFVGRRAVVEALLTGALRPPGSADATRRILDIGCGTGGMMPLLSRFGTVTGIDSEPLALDYCRRRGFRDVHLQEGFTAPAPYDLVTLFDVLEHVPDEAGFLEWIRGLLRHDGRLILTVPAFPFLWSRHDELNHHQRRYRRVTLEASLQRGGFVIDRMTYFNFWLFPAAVATRLLGGRKAGTGGDPARDAEDILKPLQIGPLNGPLTSVFASEQALIRRFDLPFGVSLGVVARLIKNPKQGD